MDLIADDPSIIKPALADLRTTFYKGKTLPISYRKQQLRNLIRGLQELEPKFHEALGKDLGVNPTMSVVISTNLTLGEVHDALSNLDKWSRTTCVDTPFVVGPAHSYLLPEPLGVALVVGAWNYPLATSIPYLAAAIAAGNCCVVKPSEVSAYTSKVIAELMDRYLDRDCYRCIEGKVEVAKAIIKEKFDVIAFTGSTEKGKLVAQAAAENLTPCILELGGKSPTIVDRNANLENAALRIVQGRYLNCGQTCIACDYLFVHREIKDELIQRIKDKLVEFYGTDASKSVDYSKIINDFHLQRIKSYLDEEHGGKVIYGGKIKPEERYIAPTLVDNPKLTSKLMQEEIFGPVLPILEFDDFDKVIQFINERPKPLALYYYGSTSSLNYKKLKTCTSSGSLMSNDSVFQFANGHLPFGGIGYSGTGKLHGYAGFKAMSHFKSVMEKATFNFYPFNARYPPYSGSRGTLLMTMLKYANIRQSTAIKSIVLLVLLGVGFSLQRRGKLVRAQQLLTVIYTAFRAFFKGEKIIA